MTSIRLHMPPRWGAVTTEQVRATFLALRREAIGFTIVWVVFFATGIRAALASVGSDRPRIRMEFAAGIGLPMVVMALLIPFSVWRGEDPRSRSYHWAMPMPRMQHALSKVSAGLAWVTTAVAAYLLCFACLAWIVHTIIGNARSAAARPWELVVPITASAITYLLGSAMVVGLRRPWLWVVACVPTMLLAVPLSTALGVGWPERAATMIWQGRYGICAAVGVTIAGADGRPSASRWGVATLIWSVVAIGALLSAARRHIEEVS